MITWVSAGVFAVTLLGMWVWVGFQRKHGHAKKRGH
jgi:hypothetical protein